MFGANCQINNGLGNFTFLSDVVPKCKEIFYNFLHDVIPTPEIVYSNHPGLEKFNKKKILIIGGGGSSNKLLNYDTLISEDNYDYIWSLNTFFLHPQIQKLKLDLVSFGPDTMDLDHEQKADYLNKFNPLVGLELHYKLYGSPERNKSIKYINEQYALNKIFFFQTKWYSILGGGVRLLILACVLGVKEISFVGFDGYSAGLSGSHSFEPGKKSLPSRLALYSDKNGRYAYEYELFWHYIREKFPQTNIISVDRDNPYHIKVK